jgi:hypothetical protein
MDPPKALIYFADTLRSNPGEHYLSFFGKSVRQIDSTLLVMDADILSGRIPFDHVVNEASAQGIRIYTVQAEGLVTEHDRVMLNPWALNLAKNVPNPSRVRSADAKRSLQDLAGETGGHAFLHGVRAPKIAERIREDSSCVYLASFDPAGFAEDAPLRVSVRVDHPEVELRVRGRLVLQSESTRLTSRLLRAFGSPDSIPDPFAVTLGLVPTGFENGAYRALLQVSVPGTPLQGATWDLGASIVSERRVRDKASGRIRVGGPGVAVVLEQEVDLKPGAYEVVGVAHESATGLIVSNETEIEWPAPTGSRITVTPIALLQPSLGAFLRDGETRLHGSLTRDPSEAVRSDRPTALVALVCHGRRHRGPLRVERTLTGRSEQGFEALTLDLEQDRCAQLRDLLPADSLRPGYHRYEVRVFEEAQERAAASRGFYAVAAESE